MGLHWFIFLSHIPVRILTTSVFYTGRRQWFLAAFLIETFCFQLHCKDLNTVFLRKHAIGRTLLRLTRLISNIPWFWCRSNIRPRSSSPMFIQTIISQLFRNVTDYLDSFLLWNAFDHFYRILIMLLVVSVIMKTVEGMAIPLAVHLFCRVYCLCFKSHITCQRLQPYLES